MPRLIWFFAGHTWGDPYVFILIIQITSYSSCSLCDSFWKYLLSFSRITSVPIKLHNLWRTRVVERELKQTDKHVTRLCFSLTCLQNLFKGNLFQFQKDRCPFSLHNELAIGECQSATVTGCHAYQCLRLSHFSELRGWWGNPPSAFVRSHHTTRVNVWWKWKVCSVNWFRRDGV